MSIIWTLNYYLWVAIKLKWIWIEILKVINILSIILRITNHSSSYFCNTWSRLIHKSQGVHIPWSNRFTWQYTPTFFGNTSKPENLFFRKRRRAQHAERTHILNYRIFLMLTVYHLLYCMLTRQQLTWMLAFIERYVCTYLSSYPFLQHL